MTTLPKPDWQTADGRIQLFNRDCMEVLPHLPVLDLALTDPPYGINRDGGRASTSTHGGRKPYEFLGWDKTTPPPDVFLAIFDKTKEQCIWGANYFPAVLPPTMGWLVWDKGQDICSSDCELAFTSRREALRRLVLNRVALQKDGAVHPTQKPLALIRWCLGFFPKAKSIVDPFMGSGTTGVAAVGAGRSFIGCETEPKYFDIAVRRIEAELNRAPLFEPPPVVQRSYLEETT